jgi:Trehalase
MTRKEFLLGSIAVSLGAARLARGEAETGSILDPEEFQHHIAFFNGMVKEDAVQYIPDAEAWPFLKANIPFFTCPDKEVEQIYYYRWWVFRKHIEETPAGFVVTEFLKPVKHAGEYNALSCAFGHHVAEGRWLRDRRFIEGDVHFWLRTGEQGGLRKNFHQFSGWAAAALYDRWLADGDRDRLLSYLDALLLDYQAWENERLTDSGLFWQRDVSDGMEESISGGRKVKNLRPSINSYMFGNARAIAEIAKMAGKDAVAREYSGKAGNLERLIETRLWNKDASFFETRRETGEFAQVRENIGFTPWYFDLPDGGKGYEVAWRQLTDPKGFQAPFGPTTAEQRNPEFKIAYEGDDCQWNGPAWPFSTTIALKGLANLLNRYQQNVMTREDYFQTFLTYTKSQHLKMPDGRTIPWIDENQNPFTGEWIARAMKIRKGEFYGRGDHYNHSGYCDLLITGLIGLRPRADDTVEVNPLLPDGEWNWFCLDRVAYHGRDLSIVWDRTGNKFGRGKGLAVFSGGREIARSARCGRVTGKLG